MAADLIILICSEAWQLLSARDGQVAAEDLSVSGDRLDRAAAEQIASVVRKRGGGGRGLALAIPSGWALAASFSTENLPRSHRHQAMTYRLEEQLPLAAEELTADFIEHGRTALGIAVRSDRLSEILFELEAAGVFVRLVCPAAILAVQGLRDRLPSSGPSFAVIVLDGRVELVGLRDGRPMSWESLPPEPTGLVAAVRAGMLSAGEDEPLPILTCELAERPRRELAAVGDAHVDAVADASALDLVGRGAPAVLAGRMRPWCNLRRDRLAPADRLRPVRAALTACAATFLMLLVALIAAAAWRASRQEALAEGYRADQAAVFRKLYPGRAVPTAVHWRLEAEARRLSGLRGGSAEAPTRRSGLERLREVFARLPGGIAVQVLELRIEPTGFLIEGRVKGHVDAERIASSLQESPALEVDSPRTERLPKVVAFTLTGRFADAREEWTVP